MKSYDLPEVRFHPHSSSEAGLITLSLGPGHWLVLVAAFASSIPHESLSQSHRPILIRL